MRYYTINVHTFRETVSRLIKPYIKRKLYESESMTFDEANNELTKIVPAITNACMAALYAKLHSIHTKFQTHLDRYATTPSYTKEIKLPVPLANAIQNFGVFIPTTNTLIHYVCIPTYPANEGGSTEHWSSDEYESYVPLLKQLGIPVMLVDTGPKLGSAWWTYKVKYIYGHYDLCCIFSPSNYPDHTAISAAMFARADDDGVALPIIQHLADDTDYPVRFREAPDGSQIKAFADLCHASCEEWTQYLPLSD
ncbi:hypothetical protein L1987_84354 [Smallanthus sonchifolius]|uniref:Uncharacterized protein n=1 Tax=Smallanthus sonchifolius TaxID=185202 RepID=A0ACB8YG07_9ASTR|nr:hypothetical protein L1987_84354 [Smallanthus sonchifolius]